VLLRVSECRDIYKFDRVVGCGSHHFVKRERTIKLPVVSHMRQRATREVVGYDERTVTVLRGSLSVEWSDWTRKVEEIGVPSSS